MAIINETAERRDRIMTGAMLAFISDTKVLNVGTREQRIAAAARSLERIRRTGARKSTERRPRNQN